ncbi:MAG: hypothetical protein V1723_00005, partial [Candidatus Uhrbacteria bacterium]
MECDLIEQKNNGRARAIIRPIAALAASGAQCAAIIIIADTNKPAADRAAATLISTLGRIAAASDLPPDPNFWLPAAITRLHRAIERSRELQKCLASACLGVAYPLDADRTAVSIAPIGAVAALRITNPNSDSRARVEIVITPEKPAALRFTQILDGTIARDAAIVIGAASCVNLDATAARTLLRERRPSPSVTDSVIIISAQALPESKRSQQSMNSLRATAASTERFLTPTLRPMLARYAEQISATAMLLRPQRGRTHVGQRALALAVHAIQLLFRTAAVATRTAAAITADTLRIAAISTRWLIRVIRSSVKNIRHRPRLTIQWRNFSIASINAFVEHKISKTIRRTRQWHAALPRTSRILLTIAVTFGILFIASTAALWRRQLVERDVTAYNITISKIEELRSLAEARLLFDDRAAARLALREAEALVAGLPRTSHARVEQSQLLEREIAATLDRARLITRLPEPLRVVNGTELFPPNGAADLALIRDSIIVIDATAANLATVNPHTGETKKWPIVTPNGFRPLRLLAFDDRTILLLAADGHALSADINTGTTAELTIENATTIIDAALYQRRLYLLRADGSITRHERTSGGFDRGR